MCRQQWEGLDDAEKQKYPYERELYEWLEKLMSDLRYVTQLSMSLYTLVLHVTNMFQYCNIAKWRQSRRFARAPQPFAGPK